MNKLIAASYQLQLLDNKSFINYLVHAIKINEINFNSSRECSLSTFVARWLRWRTGGVWGWSGFECWPCALNGVCYSKLALSLVYGSYTNVHINLNLKSFFTFRGRQDAGGVVFVVRGKIAAKNRYPLFVHTYAMDDLYIYVNVKWSWWNRNKLKKINMEVKKNCI